MRHHTLISLAALLLLATIHPSVADGEEGGWTLVWQDDFTGDRIDDSKWSICKRGKPDWSRHMTDDARCYRQSGGILTLIGLHTDAVDPADAYLTGGIHSMGKFSFTYGKVEIRARFKSAQGGWPALWLMPSKNPDRVRTFYGEIDLMEHLNFDDKVYQTIHSTHTLEIDKEDPLSHITAAIDREAWNTYGATWDRSAITFLVNGRATMTYPKVDDKGTKQWPFDRDYYLILSMQIDGKWVGKPDPSHYPAHMEIDWVRVYRPSR